MNEDSTIYRYLGQYLAGDITLQHLHLAVMPLLWDLDPDTEGDTRKLAARIELYLSEYGRGHRSEAETLEVLRPLADAHRVDAVETPGQNRHSA